MEIFDLHLERQERRSDSFYPIGLHGDIKRIGLERNGGERAYCALFTQDGTVTYRGVGKGLEGNAIGKADLGRLFSVLRFLATLELDALPDDYFYSGLTVTYQPDTLTDALLLVETGTSIKTLLFHEGAVPPLLFLALDMLDLLIDSATWDRHGFFIQRDLSVKPLPKRKWDKSKAN